METPIKPEKEKCIPCGGVKPLLSTPNLKIGKNGISLDIGGIPLMIILAGIGYGFWYLINLMF
jgi:hypothetical protein